MPVGENERSTARRLAEVTRSRREIVEAFEIERRRIEGDLHDGVQQYLVAAAMKLGEAEFEFADRAHNPDWEQRLAQLLGEAREHITEGQSALRRIVHGIHPHTLEDQGLVASVSAEAARYGSHISVFNPVPLPALAPTVLSTAYFFCTECLTNAAKYAPGAPVSVLIVADQTLQISVTDNGPGGATLRDGHGLSGMTERLRAIGGWLQLRSPDGGPTTITANIPLLLDRGQPGIAPTPSLKPQVEPSKGSAPEND